jgi:hypothetical protein
VTDAAEPKKPDKSLIRTIPKMCGQCGQPFLSTPRDHRRSIRLGYAQCCSTKCGARQGNRKNPAGKIALDLPVPWLQKAYSIIYKSSKKQGKHRHAGEGIEHEFSKEEFNALIKRAGHRCEVTGIPFSNSSPVKFQRRPWIPSLDRIDSTGPYSVANCRLVCVAANLAMNAWGHTVLGAMAVSMVEKAMRESKTGRSLDPKLKAMLTADTPADSPDVTASRAPAELQLISEP